MGLLKRTVKLIAWLITGAVVLAVVAGTAVAGVFAWKGYNMYCDAVEQTPVADKIASIQQTEGYVYYDELPEIYIDAVISVEDKRFFSHGGVDPLAIVRAAFNDLRTLSFVEGGSTITQQIAKNEYFTQEKKLLRKVAELFVAFDLEKDYTKDEILELYLNTIYFGSGYYCVYDAAEGYFGKEPSQMTDYESTLLAGIPNAPSVYSLTNSPELAAQRQKTVLECMVQQAYITQEQADEILAEGKVQQAEEGRSE